MLRFLLAGKEQQLHLLVRGQEPRKDVGIVTDSNSTLDDEVDDEPVPDSRETCWFWESRAARCHFEAVVPGSEPCADCPEDTSD